MADSDAAALKAPRTPEALLRRWLGGIRIGYLPVLITYFCYGASAVTSVALLYFEKDVLGLTPAEAAGIAFWLGLPWSMKMVAGVASDVYPILGSRRGSYLLLGALCSAAGYAALATTVRTRGSLPGVLRPDRGGLHGAGRRRRRAQRGDRRERRGDRADPDARPDRAADRGHQRRLSLRSPHRLDWQPWHPGRGDRAAPDRRGHRALHPAAPRARRGRRAPADGQRAAGRRQGAAGAAGRAGLRALRRVARDPRAAVQPRDRAGRFRRAHRAAPASGRDLARRGRGRHRDLPVPGHARPSARATATGRSIASGSISSSSACWPRSPPC